MIRIVSLTQKTRNPFFEYLPQIARDMAEMQTTLAIGAVMEEKGEPTSAGILPLSDLPSFEWNVLSPLLRQHDLVTDYRSYDHQMSCFQKEGDRIVAMLLTRRMPSGSIFPVFLRRFPGTGTGSPAPLLSFSLKACKSLPPEIPVYIRCTGTQSGKVLDILFPEKMPALVRKGSFSI